VAYLFVKLRPKLIHKVRQYGRFSNAAAHPRELAT
jgi:hypothetical protein